MGKISHSLSRRDFIKLTSAAGIASLIPGCRPLSSDKKKMNVLFIMVDDLRPELGCYGSPEIKTPNFDAFARQSVMFTNAYCQAAACAPSRACVMLGQRADSTGVLSNQARNRENNHVKHIQT